MESLNSNSHERELHQLQQMQHKAKESCMKSFRLLHSHLKQKSKVVLSKAVDVDLVVMESNGIESEKQDTRSSSGNYLTHVVDADIRPVNDQLPFAETNTQALLLIGKENSVRFSALYLKRKEKSSYFTSSLYNNSISSMLVLSNKGINDQACSPSEEPVEIMDREVKRLKQSRIPIVKVRWNSRRGPEFTWEREDQMQKKYPHLFTNSAPAAEVAS
ncbi:hypothetical protein Tco_1296375 [Tanacetum coccineum]